MAVIEAVLIIIGVAFILVSFFVTEKMSPKEVDKLAGLTKNEMDRIVQNEVTKAEGRIKDTIDEQIEESVVKVSREMEKVSNDKIMSINEFSNTVIDGINKNHSEVMFLYGMLSDKEEELKSSVKNAEELHSELAKNTEEIHSELSRDKEEATSVPVKTPAKGFSEHIFQNLPREEATIETADATAKMAASTEAEGKAVMSFFMEQGAEVYTQPLQQTNHKDAILERHRKGKSIVQIAKELNLGQGEVKLVLDLYEGGRR